MNKLMFAVAGVAVAGGAFANPIVYDYKASVKHMYLKETSVTVDGVKTAIYTKYQKSSSLKGYLIMDYDGVTSPAIMKDLDAGYTTYSNGYDFGRNRGFLVVQNPNAWKGVRAPKILPAVLDAKWIDTAFTKNHTATSGIAEGTLYVGGDAVKPVRPALDRLQAGISERKDDTPATIIPNLPGYTPAAEANVEYTGMVAAADYVWTSIYLFAGSSQKDAYFNGPNWFRATAVSSKVSPFGVFEYKWDQNLPTLLRTGWAEVQDGDGNILGYGKTPVNYFHDTWMNGAGFGKWTKGKITTKHCCGIVDSTGSDEYTLDSLSGNLKGGLFLCTENGIVVGSAEYNWFGGNAWEDQFATARLDVSDYFNADAWQNDLWQDGFVEQETTDVIYGTWSIKINTKLMDGKDALIAPTTDVASLYTYATEVYINKSNSALLNTLYSAAYKLNKNVNFADGSEIYAETTQPIDPADLPMITPQFAQFYRLVYGIKDE